jgi:hypothetical protein
MFNKNPIPVLRRKLGSWRRKSLAEQGWFMVAYPLLGLARLLLGLRGIPYALFLGVRKDETDPAGMAAHAWVCSGRAFITGGQSFGQFTVVGTFISSGVVGV